MKARRQRQLAKNWVDAFNGDSSEMNKIDNERRTLLVNGARYGNKRKAVALLKRIERRVIRRELNGHIPEE
jgi:hypothetical protein